MCAKWDTLVNLRISQLYYVYSSCKELEAVAKEQAELEGLRGRLSKLKKVRTEDTTTVLG